MACIHSLVQTAGDQADRHVDVKLTEDTPESLANRVARGERSLQKRSRLLFLVSLLSFSPSSLSFFPHQANL